MTTNILNTTNNQNSLSLYPSPATDLVKIEYQTNGASNISISIFDAQGREIEKIFSGVHHVNKIYEWNSKNYNGTFYCQILSDNSVITKPIFIQK
jgi:hypothetical protein